MILTDLPLKYLAHAHNDTKDKPLVIFLHGYGSNEEDLFMIKDHFIPDCTYLSVRAPTQISPSSYQWFTLQLSLDGVMKAAKEVQENKKVLEDFISKAVTKYKTDKEKVILVGFSQGAIMSYEIALRNPEAVRGIIALSGMILPTLQNEIRTGQDLKNLAVFIGHGDQDHRIPIGASIAANDVLAKTSITPSFHQYPYLGHSINQTVLNDIKKWIEATLSNPRYDADSTILI